MRSKATAVKEDPETAARRAVEEARAEADRTSATQGLLDRRTRRVLRIFGRPIGGGGSGASGVPAAPTVTTGSSSVGGFSGAFSGGGSGRVGGSGRSSSVAY